MLRLLHMMETHFTKKLPPPPQFFMHNDKSMLELAI